MRNGVLKSHLLFEELFYHYGNILIIQKYMAGFAQSLLILSEVILSFYLLTLFIFFFEKSTIVMYTFIYRQPHFPNHDLVC